MVTVWILFLVYYTGSYDGGMAIDHAEFDTKDSCVAAATYAKKVQDADKAFCVPATRYREGHMNAPSR